jgi:hypothetical protein
MTSAQKSPFTKGLQGADLTLKQRAFIVTLVRQGCTPTQAARTAGYVDPKVSAYDLLRSPHIQAAIRFERSRYVMSDLANIATGTLREVMTDKQAPASARVQAARTVLEMSGELGRGKSDADEDRPLSELSAEELTRMIDKWQDERAALAKPIDQDDQTLTASLNMAQLTH